MVSNSTQAFFKATPLTTSFKASTTSYRLRAYYAQIRAVVKIATLFFRYRLFRQFEYLLLPP